MMIIEKTRANRAITIDTMISMYSLGGFFAEVAEKTLKGMVHPILAQKLLADSNCYQLSEIDAIDLAMKKADSYPIQTKDFRNWIIEMSLELQNSSANVYEDFFAILERQAWQYEHAFIFTELEKMVLYFACGFDDGKEKEADEISKTCGFSCPASYIACILNNVRNTMEKQNLTSCFSKYAEEYRIEHTKGDQL